MSIIDTLKSGIAVLVAVVLLWFVGATGAHAEEVRRLEVVGFDFATAEVLLQDEDGFIWTCPFGENSWSVGEEYVLIIDGENISIESIDEV